MRKKDIVFGGILAAALLAGMSSAKADINATELYSLSNPKGVSHAFVSSQSWGVAAGGQVVGGSQDANGNNLALLWTADGSAVNLHPSGFTYSVALATNGTQQGGWGQINGNNHALLWSGSATSVIDLNPSGYDGSALSGIGGGQQVGLAYGPTTIALQHAMIWAGTAASAVDLNPAGMDSSVAYATDGLHQVGNIFSHTFTDGSHAALWSGTAGSAVDLNPSWLADGGSGAYGIGRNQQVGFGYGNVTGIADHALLWSGTADSAVDLNPSPSFNSIAYGTNGVYQVGSAISTPHYHAYLWNGTATSAIDLQSYLPPDVTWTESYAYTIDSSNNIYGVAYGTQNGNNVIDAVEWTVTPEPTTLPILALCGLGLLARRRQRRHPVL